MPSFFSGASPRRSPRKLTRLEPSIVLDIKKGKAKEVLVALLDDNVNVQEESTGDTALHLSIAFHKTKISDKLLRVKSLDINAINSKGQTPLHIAILHRNTSAIQSLLKRHAELKPAIADNEGCNILHYAAMKSLSSSEIKKILTRLQKSHGDLTDLVKLQNKAGNTPLHQAVEHGSIDTEKLFISYSPDRLSCRNDKQETPLDISLRVGKGSQTAMLLSQSPPTLYPNNLLSLIIESNMYELLGQLFVATSDANLAKGTASVMGYPLTSKSLEAIKTRISGYNDLDTETGLSHIHQCIIKGKAEVMKVLLFVPDIDLTLRDREGNTALNLSFDPKYYSPDVVHLLLDWLSMKKQLSDGVTRSLPKQMKSQINSDHAPLWSLFVSAVINRQNATGTPPIIQVFHCAAAMGEKMMLYCIQQLIDLGADVTSFDAKANTPLFYAAFHGNVKVVELLRIAGASSTVLNNEGVTPVDVALEREDEELVNALTVDLTTLQKATKTKKK